MSAKKDLKEGVLQPPAAKGGEDEEQFPIDTAVLADDLKAFRVRAPASVAAYPAQGDLEHPYWLDRGLSDINPVL